MQKVIEVSLTGHAEAFRLDEEAYETLSRYLDGARGRIGDASDRDEVIDDLERSIGEKLSAISGSGSRVVDEAAMRAVLADVGDIPAAAGEVPGTRTTTHDPRRGRRLLRVREGQQLAGVCTGVSLYTGVTLDWVRTIFVLLAIFTGGIFILVYLAMTFILPIVATEEEYHAAQPVLNDAG